MSLYTLDNKEELLSAADKFGVDVELPNELSLDRIVTDEKGEAVAAYYSDTFGRVRKTIFY